MDVAWEASKPVQPQAECQASPLSPIFGAPAGLPDLGHQRVNQSNWAPFRMGQDGNQKEHAREAKKWYEMCNYMTPLPGLAQEISTRCQSSPNIPDFQAGAWSTCRSSQCVQLGVLLFSSRFGKLQENPIKAKNRHPSWSFEYAESPAAFWVPNAAAPAGPRRRRRNQQASHQGSRPGRDPVCCPGGAPFFC